MLLVRKCTISTYCSSRVFTLLLFCSKGGKDTSEIW